MKRFTFLSIIMIIAIALSVLTSCSKSGGSDNIETIVYSGNKCTIPMTFEESISHATAIVRAEFVSIPDNSERTIILSSDRLNTSKARRQATMSSLPASGEQRHCATKTAVH